MDLYDILGEENKFDNTPLAQRMKPRKLADFVGQKDVLGEGSLLSKMISEDKLRSLVLYGPPGSGKTSIAEIIASETKSKYIRINAVTSGLEDIKRAISFAKENLAYNKRTIVFIDEIHRFNKRQQDALLPDVENGVITLIGATTENPYFEVNSALISRLSVVRLEPLSYESISKIVSNAISLDPEIKTSFTGITEEACDILYRYSSGDARKALNALEGATTFSNGGELTAEILNKTLGTNSLSYDKSGDMHYDVISAFIKSIRGSDPQAAVHYLARMLEAGEDPMFIARRLVISASEDIGNADPMALLLANAAKDAVHFVGMPEARIALSQATCYLASTLKSNKAYLAIENAISDVKKADIGTVPVHLRDSSYRSAKKLGNAIGYKYPHDYNGAYVKQDYMPEKLRGRVYYEPSSRGREKTIKAYLEEIEKNS